MTQSVTYIKLQVTEMHGEIDIVTIVVKDF